MPGFVEKSFERRLIFALVMVVLLAAVFWTQSRYPALDEKAIMSARSSLRIRWGSRRNFR